MKNTIMYYYNLNNVYLYKLNGKNYIKNKEDIYLFQPIYNEKEVIEIYQILKENDKYYSMILNKENNIFTILNGQKFVLLKKTNNQTEFTRDLFERITLVENKYLLDRTNWYFLWTEKIDYFEYQINHIAGKYPEIDESIDYFIGMAETAVSYITYNAPLKKEEEEKKVICHRRINIEDYYNPLNLVIDYKERDISEYLKYIFWTGEYKNTDIRKIIQLSNSSIYGYHLLYGRLFYPSFYFDIYEKIINEKENTEKIKKIILRIDEYEIYTNYIFGIINEFQEIRKIEWVQKNVSSN